MTRFRACQYAPNKPSLETFKEEAIALPLSQLNVNELTVALVNRYNHTWPLAIQLVSSGRVDVKPLITHHVPLEESADALTLSSRVGDSVKAVIHPQL